MSGLDGLFDDHSGVAAPQASPTEVEQDSGNHDTGGGDQADNRSKNRATSTTPSVSTPTDGPPAIKFSLHGDSWAGERVLEVGVGPGARIAYRVNPKLSELFLDSAQLCPYEPAGSNDQCFENFVPSGLFPRQGSGTADPSTTLMFNMPSQTAEAAPFFLLLKWNYRMEEDGSLLEGESTSGLFTQLRVGESLEEVQETFERRHGDAERDGFPLWNDNTPQFPAEVQEIIQPDAQASPSPEATTTGTLTSATVLPTATDGLTDSGDDGVENISDNGSGGGGGLSTGAIAGIGVGAGVVVLAIIGALIWFFCLRNRRKNKDVKGPYSAPEGQASEFMVNKETNAHVTESPHSPYSDDGSLARTADQQQQHHHHQAQPYGHDAQQPYSDAPPIAAPVPRSASQQAHVSDRPVSRSGARSGTPAGNVSHLIEDGMTEADIRRLEEEERALDDAIERAGHHQRRT